MKDMRHATPMRHACGGRRCGDMALRPHPLAACDPAAREVNADGLALPWVTRCCDVLDNRPLTAHRTCSELRPAQVAQPAQKCPAANQNLKIEA